MASILHPRLAAFLIPLICTGAFAAEQTHVWFRFTPTKLRDNPQPNSVQISEFNFRLHGQPLDMTLATVTNPGGNNPAAERPEKLTDGDTVTKWLDFNRRAVVFRFPQAVTIDAYSFTTANDAPERDPRNWRLEGSDDGSTWHLLDEIIDGPVPTGRRTATGSFPLKVTVPPYTSFWHPDYLLRWTPADDTSADFNRSFVPLAARSVNPALNVNSNARPNEGRVAVLTTFGATSFQPSQGSTAEHFNAYTGWPYTDRLVFWGGAAGEGLILAPSAPVIDAGHRNGVPVLGTVFFPPTAYGGQFHWVRTFLQKNGNDFPVADKLIEVARHYGFDGWFINQETAGGNSTDAANMRDFILYFRTRAPELEIMWYDAMTSGGGVSWQNALTASNEMFMMHNSQPVSHTMFLNFWWNSGMLANSRARALSLGIDPYSVYAGVDVESGGSNTNFDWNAVFPAGQAHRLSLAFYGQQRVFQNSGNPSGFQNAELRFWSGANHDPSNTATDHHWKGLAHYIPATTPLRQLPFVTNFNRGQGNRFAVDGTVLMTGGWNNLSLQDILPTWRWIVSSTGTKLQPSLELDDAYYGGASLKISGTLNATNDVKLYAASLPVTEQTRFRLVYKSNQGTGPTRMQVALSFEDAPATFTYFNVGSAPATGWNTTTLNLGAHAGKKIAVIGLRFTGSPAISDYQMRIGRIAIYDGAIANPAPPANLRIMRRDALDADSLAIRLKWDPSATPGIHHYRIVQRFPNGTRRWLGGTPNHAFFIPAARRLASEGDLTIEVSAVGAEFGVSPVVTTTIPLPPPPDMTFRLTGASIGTEGSWNNNGMTRERSFDGNTSTYFDAPTQSAWTGRDFGAGREKRITAIRYHPRTSWTSRMLNGVFEGANQPDFSDAVNLGTVLFDPPGGVFTIIPVTWPGTFRYFRYNNTAGHGNVSEIEVYGYEFPATPAAPSASLSIGSAAVSWNSAAWATGYRIERSATAGGPFTMLAENHATTGFSDTSVTAGQRPYYRVTALNPLGASAPSPAVQAQPASPYVAWHLENFGDETSEEITGPQADPDDDRLPNLLEYALGLDPFASDAPGFDPAFADNRLSITYPRNIVATDAPLTAQWSDDLQTWRTDGITHEVLSEENGRRTVRSTAPAGGDGRRFMRLHAVSP